MTLVSTEIPIWVVWFRDEKKDKKLEFQGKEIGPDQEGGVGGNSEELKRETGKRHVGGELSRKREEVVWPSFSSLGSPYIVALARMGLRA